MRSDGGGVHDVRVRLFDDRVRAYVVLGYHAIEMTIAVEGKLYSRRGMVQFEPTSGEIGSVPIPQASLVTAMQKMMREANERQKLMLPANVSDLRVEKGPILVTYD